MRASEEKKGASKEVKEERAAAKAATDARTAYALVDGHLEKTANCTVEPPGLFRGRGEHPKMGTVKRRIAPEEITINCAPGVPVPACPVPGHSWKRVVHDPSVSWLAFWVDPVGGNHKYVYLAASSSFKGQADRDKYEKARKLVKHIGAIRATYEKMLGEADELERQLGTCMWIIDRLALRVGGEKEEDEADTVGTCSLRPEHVSFPTDTDLELNFLGKDSMRYHNTIDLSRYGDVGLRVLHNLKKLCKGKDPVEENVFDMVDPSRLNKELSDLMPGLSAKVFRTYNASITLQQELERLPVSLSVLEKKNEYDRANRQVAILCNHQKTVSKGVEDSLADMHAKIDRLKAQLGELQQRQAGQG
jgi:DNA topoisomerase-1